MNAPFGWPAPQLWVSDSSAPNSRLVVLDQLDWYVLQEEMGVRIVLSTVSAFMEGVIGQGSRSEFPEEASEEAVGLTLEVRGGELGKAEAKDSSESLTT